MCRRPELEVCSLLLLNACTLVSDSRTDALLETGTYVDTAGEVSEGEAEGPLEADATLSANGVTITIENGSGEYVLGMAETDPASPDPWTGEDCLNGHVDAGLLYCHRLSSTGGVREHGFLTDLADDAEDDDDGYLSMYTLFFEDLQVTYALWNEDMDCFTWGQDSTYYTGVGCTDLGHD